MEGATGNTNTIITNSTTQNFESNNTTINKVKIARNDSPRMIEEVLSTPRSIAIPEIGHFQTRCERGHPPFPPPPLSVTSHPLAPPRIHRQLQGGELGSATNKMHIKY
jgi:hypothetical protein